MDRDHHHSAHHHPAAASPVMVVDPLDVALRIGRGTLPKIHQNLGWAIGYNAIALPTAAGVFEPA